MRTEILTPSQRDVLERLKTLPEVAAFYLAGGTALALHLGHRRSVDFDFFTAQDFDAADLHERLRQEFDDAPVLRQAARTLYVRLLGVTTSFFAYRYPLLDAATPTPWGFGLAGLRDIAAMKLEAIAGRGSRKDFVDLYVLCKQFELLDVFYFFAEKYRGSGYDPYHRLRALTHFTDAEAQPLPEMMESVEWRDVRRFFEERARSLWEGTRLP
jgi:nucleotidyltransferase AbiEii toxin of type IV toxin-antitoxin system